MNENMLAARILGRVVTVERLGRMKGDFNFGLHALKRIAYIGVTFRRRSRNEVALIHGAVVRDLGGRLAEFNIPIAKTFPLADGQAAQHDMAGNKHFRNKHFGKIFLQPDSNVKV